MTRTSIARWAPGAVFLLVPSALILPIAFRGGLLYGHDVVSVFHYSRIFIAESFRAGRLPLWNPHVMAGFPLLAAMQGAVFYPPTWLCVVLPAGLFWTLSAWAHLILAGLFAHRWLERGLGVGPWSALAGGFVYMMSGFIAGHLFAGHVNYVWAYPWIPAVLGGLERYLAAPGLKRGVLVAAPLAMLFLAGVPQFVFFTGLLVSVRLLHFVLVPGDGSRERLVQAGQAAAWLFLGLLSCAPQLFPTLELVAEMQRGSREGDGFLTDYSLEPAGLVDLLSSSIRHPRNGNYWWETCGYVGGASFLLALAAFFGKHPQRHGWAVIGIAAVLLALGPHLPFYAGFNALVPGAALFRGPGRYLLLFTVATAALTGLGFDALWNRGKPGLRIAAGVLAVVGGFQLAAFGDRYFRSQAPNLLWPPSFVETLRNRVGLEGRVASGFRMPVDAIGKCEAAGVDQIGGYEPMMLRRFAESINAARGAPFDSNLVILASVDHHAVIDLLGARVWLQPDLAIHDYRDSMPRAWVVNHAVVIESKEDRLLVMAAGGWDPRRTVILEKMPEEAPPVRTESSAGQAKVVSKAPGGYVIEAQNGADAYLVLSEAYYPGWRAEIDGRPAEVLPADHVIQAVRLPPGRHVVSFEYRSRFLAVGFAVAALAAGIPLALLVRRRRG